VAVSVIQIGYFNEFWVSYICLMGSKSGSEPEILGIAETFKTTADQPSIPYTLGPC